MFAHISAISSLLCLSLFLVASEGAVKRDAASEIKSRYGNFRENCFPRPSGGCQCTIKDPAGNDIVQTYANDAQCRITSVETLLNKALVNEEIKEKYGNFKENCFPKPSGGCRCNEKDATGKETVKTYNDDAQCKVRRKRSTLTSDPVREKAQQNYRAVVDELNQKFKGLKEGCFPRPKGCLCVIGKDRDGRDITERRMKEADCKCKAGERGNGCPAQGA